MNAKSIGNDVKNEVTKGIEKLTMLRDEVKLHLHLASLDAKKEWDEKLEPHIAEVETSAQHLSEASRTAVHDLVSRVEGFYAKLRKTSSPS